MRRLSLSLALAVVALAAAPAALADGPSYVVQGGVGAGTPGSAVHWVTVSDGNRRTLLERLQHGEVNYWFPLKGMWGTPTLGAYAPQAGQGLSQDGKTLVLSAIPGPYATPSRFLVLDLRRMRVVRKITLAGSFSFDALSPRATRMYLIQYTHGARDLTHYIVRGYDLRTNRLLPGRIADRTQKNWVMKGSPLTRTWSANGRWVYTLYTDPGSYPFVHALDTKRGVAHCVQLPWEEDRSQDALYNLALHVRDGGRTLALDWKSGHPWVRVTVGSWRVSEAGGGFPWAWVAGGAGGGLGLLSAAAFLLRWRRRREEVQQRPREELGLA
jgi:hypothetical protein